MDEEYGVELNSNDICRLFSAIEFYEDRYTDFDRVREDFARVKRLLNESANAERSMIEWCDMDTIPASGYEIIIELTDGTRRVDTALEDDDGGWYLLHGISLKDVKRWAYLPVRRHPVHPTIKPFFPIR